MDLTGFLFGDVLAVRGPDLGYLVARCGGGAVSVLGHRLFVALAFDERKAHTLGFRPRLARAMLGLVTLAIVASFHVVGTLLVFGLLDRAARRHGAVGPAHSGDHARSRAARRSRDVDRAAASRGTRHGRRGDHRGGGRVLFFRVGAGRGAAPPALREGRTGEGRA